MLDIQAIVAGIADFPQISKKYLLVHCNYHCKELYVLNLFEEEDLVPLISFKCRGVKEQAQRFELVTKYVTTHFSETKAIMTLDQIENAAMSKKFEATKFSLHPKNCCNLSYNMKDPVKFYNSSYIRTLDYGTLPNGTTRFTLQNKKGVKEYASVYVASPLVANYISPNKTINIWKVCRDLFHIKESEFLINFTIQN